MFYKPLIKQLFTVKLHLMLVILVILTSAKTQKSPLIQS